jgi:hypothetical protein
MLKNIKEFFIALMPWIFGKAAFDLGIGVLSFGGYVLILGLFTDYIDSSVSGLPADVLAIATLSGVMEGLSWVIAAVTTRMTIAAFPRLGVLKPLG